MVRRINSSQDDCFDRGAIVRIRLRNFMTYTDTELEPGPNLNMILGPNGTGKSAVVCCIIVGLAGEVTLTGRGGSPADFVKKDQDQGGTEIELYNDRGANFIIQRKIIITNRSQFKLDHKSEWKINGKSVLKSEVQDLTRKLNIKVDNLCQFLPQDSVTQFVKMNTCELLLNTLKAGGDNQLVEDHKKLVDITKEVSEKRIALDELQRSCAENEIHAKRLESEVHQLRQREELVKQKAIVNQKIHYLRYVEAKETSEKTRQERDKLKDDLKQIESISEPHRLAAEFHKEEEKRLREAVERSNKEIQTATNLIQEHFNTIESRKYDCQNEFSKFKGKQEAEAERATSITLKNQELDSYECKLNDARDVDCSRQIEQVKSEMSECKNEIVTHREKRFAADSTISNLNAELTDTKREQANIQAVKEKKISLLKAKFPDAYRILEWLYKNTQLFEKPVFHPLMCEINVKDPKYNRIVEHAVSRQELSAFLCQTPTDLRTFTRGVRDTLNLRPNVILVPEKTSENFERESSQSSQNFNLDSFGSTCFLKDLVDAPEPVMRFLCGNNNFHRIPVFENVSEAQLKQLLQKCPKFYVGGEIHTVNRSKYDGATIHVRDHVRNPSLLVYSLDTKRLEVVKAKYEKLQETRASCVTERDKSLKLEDEAKEKWERLSFKLKELNAKQDEKKKLETLISRARDALERLKKDKIDIEVERGKLQRSIERINKDIVESLEKLVEVHKNLVTLKESVMTNLLLCKVANTNYKIAVRKYKTSLSDTASLKERISDKQKLLDTLKRAQIELKKTAEEKVPGFKENQLDRATLRKFNSIDLNTVDELVAKREDLMVKIQRIYKDSTNSVMAEYQRQNEELRDKKLRITELEAAIKTISAVRDEIKTSWIEKTEKVIGVINENYKDFMQKLSYDGQVKLDFREDDRDNFAAYGIMILVKYRDNEQLIPLSSTRQSGGERSVATMIYMLALQTKTTVPFRCVDEINQGMDKDNERKVFELLVQTADSSSSQYFLVSPKLLKDLPYSEKMRIHVVYNGKKLGLAWNDL